MTTAPDPPADAPFTAEELDRVRDALYARTGMQFGDGKQYYVERRLRDRMDATMTPTVSAYLAFLRADPGEAEALINSFTVNETYFYREEHQLRCLADQLLPEIVRTRGPGDRVRIWSVPCASGEEPYSIVIWLLENWRMVDAYNVEIVGSDIDTRMLAAAREGRFDVRALSRLPAELIAAYFEPAEEDGRQQIIQDLRESVTLTHVNLVDRTSMMANGVFDVVFCRNVLIYFDDIARQAAAQNLFDCVAPGGFVCLGHSESFSRLIDRFRVRRFTDAVVYQRPAA